MISDEALEAATHLSSRYVTERFLPDKAIDLIDESSSRVRMYKSPAAKHAKDLFGQLRAARQNRSLAQEEGNPDDIKEWEDRETALGEQIEKLRSGWDRANSPVVTAEDIAEVVSMWTGVPLMQLAEAESQRLLKMEEELQKSIIGQEDAILAISRASAPRPRRSERSEAPDWFVHLPRPNRRWQNGTHQSIGEVYVR